MSRTLIVTNDFPPRQGGIETFVHAMAVRFPDDEVVVHTSATPGGEAFDAGLPFPVVRDPARTLLPTGAATRRTAELIRRHRCDSVWFGAAAPLGLMTPALRRRTDARIFVATTHGHEVWWARTPGARTLLRRIGDHVDTLTHLGGYTRDKIAHAVGPAAAARMRRLTPGVDAAVFQPHGDRSGTRARYGLGERPVVLCAARLVPRKGQDTLIRALRQVHRACPDAALLIVGSGPYARELRALAAAEGVRDSVVFAGGHPHGAMPSFYAAADVFAMPCRTRRAGLEVEGLGIVFLEAAAAGLPVVVGASGGAPDAVRDGETGYVVDGRDSGAVAARLLLLLENREAAQEMGRKGQSWVRAEWGWDRQYRTLAGLLGRDR
ncbi:glycosyltransferase family 4 protein [Streptomyces sp. NPDC020141]|uniref:glycosyltransferase family 4 protein n=1 Tax=Streptomyces sp. NPDC020141 TaxID=3365065 RepID=UPI0037B09261